MIIKCSACDARFRMRESMLEGFRGAQVRCRRCGGTITVEKPGAGTRRPRPRTAPVNLDTHSHAAPDAGHAPPGTAPTEIPVRSRNAPDNVYPLERFRQSGARKPVGGGFDISGRLRPEPEGAPDVSIPWAAALSVAAASEPEPERIPPSLLDESLPDPGEETPALKTAPDLGKARRWPFGIRRRSRGNGGVSRLCFPRPLHIAVVYLFLLFLGGLAYLLVQFLLSPGFKIR